MIEAAWKAAQLEVVSPQRTEMLVQKAQEAGASPEEAGKLARHFDAATEFVESLPQPQRQAVHKAVEERFGPQPG